MSSLIGRDIAIPAQRRPAKIVLDVVIPTYNEQADLEASVRRLWAHLHDELPYPFRITIADNASTDATVEIARCLEAALPEVRVISLTAKGRGRALRAAWASSQAEVLAYMDVDLSTGLTALLPLIAPLVSGHSDLAIGTRLHRAAQVTRGPKREFVSRCYNLLLRGTLATRFSDAQCGFKAIRAEVARELLPLVQDEEWFFDTELLVLAERAGLRIHEVPVDWVDDPGSTVDIVRTARADLRGIVRLAMLMVQGKLPVEQLSRQFSRHQSGSVDTEAAYGGLLGQLLRFATVGTFSTVLFLLLFLAMRPELGSQGGNAAALLLATLANTAVNRRFTFGISGRRHLATHQLQGLMVFAIGLSLTSLALDLAQRLDPRGGSAAQIVALLVANGAAMLLRFLLLRNWVFRAASGTSGAGPLRAGDSRQLEGGSAHRESSTRR